jgi:hypothetical protein
MNNQVQSGSVSVRRVSLPRYEVTFSLMADALRIAQKVRDTRVLTIEAHLAEVQNQEIVIDMRVDGETTMGTFLFRLTHKDDSRTALEWYPRRKTDPELLDVWIAWLDEHFKQGAGASNFSLNPGEIFGMLELCRRSLQRNPFEALAIHWSADGDAVAEALAAARTTIIDFRHTEGAGQRAGKLLERALAEFNEAAKALATREQRHKLRYRYVSEHAIAQAVELADSKMAIAKLRQDKDAYKEAHAEFLELNGPTP